MLSPEQITDRLLDQVKKHNAKVWVGELNNPKMIETLGLNSNEKLKLVVDGDALKHIETKHGANSIMAKNGQPPITNQDIANLNHLINTADQYILSPTRKDTRIVVGKQINGYVVVVEVVSKKNNRLMLKNMYKEHGKLENSKEFKTPISNHNVANSRPSARPGEDLDTAMGGVDDKVLALKSQERPYRVITDKEAFIKNLDLSATATPIPKELDVKGFLKRLQGVHNKTRFIEHLQSRNNAKQRLEYLNLVEPTLTKPDIQLIFKEPPKQEYIKAFKTENQKDLTYLLVTMDNDKVLVTGIVDAPTRYLKRQIRIADIIHAFIPPNRLADAK
nr:hypothetical protein [Helicobacter suis]